MQCSQCGEPLPDDSEYPLCERCCLATEQAPEQQVIDEDLREFQRRDRDRHG